MEAQWKLVRCDVGRDGARDSAARSPPWRAGKLVFGLRRGVRGLDPRFRRRSDGLNGA